MLRRIAFYSFGAIIVFNFFLLVGLAGGLEADLIGLKEFFTKSLILIASSCLMFLGIELFGK